MAERAQSRIKAQEKEAEKQRKATQPATNGQASKSTKTMTVRDFFGAMAAQKAGGNG